MPFPFGPSAKLPGGVVPQMQAAGESENLAAGRRGLAAISIKGVETGQPMAGGNLSGFIQNKKQNKKDVTAWASSP